MNTAKRDIRSLTGLRGIAAIWVATYHYYLAGSAMAFPAGVEAVLKHGYLAVDIFFVLSGFVMAMSYAHFFAGPFAFRRYGVFLVRRIARIYPLFIVMTILICCGMVFGIGEPFLFKMRPVEFIANMFLVQAWGFGSTVDGPAWSVSVELAAYLLFPGLVALALRSRPVIAMAMTLFCIGLMLWLEMTPLAVTPWRVGPLDIVKIHSILPTLRCLGEFALGLLAFRFAGHKTSARLSGSTWLTFLILAGMGVVAAIPRADFGFVILAPLLIVGLSGSNMMSRILGSSVPVFLGEISYAMYLIHEQLLRIQRIGNAKLDHILGGPAAGLVALVAFYCVLIVFAYLAYRVIENPARHYVRQAEKLFEAGAEEKVGISEQQGLADLNLPAN